MQKSCFPLVEHLEEVDYSWLYERDEVEYIIEAIVKYSTVLILLAERELSMSKTLKRKRSNPFGVNVSLGGEKERMTGLLSALFGD